MPGESSLISTVAIYQGVSDARRLTLGYSKRSCILAEATNQDVSAKAANQDLLAEAIYQDDGFDLSLRSLI